MAISRTASVLSQCYERERNVELHLGYPRSRADQVHNLQSTDILARSIMYYDIPRTLSTVEAGSPDVANTLESALTEHSPLPLGSTALNAATYTLGTLASAIIHPISLSPLFI